MNNVKKMKTIYVNLEYLLYDSIKLRVDKVQNFSKKIRTVINKSGIRNSVGLGYNLYAAIDTSLVLAADADGQVKELYWFNSGNSADRKTSIESFDGNLRRNRETRLCALMRIGDFFYRQNCIDG